MKLRVLLLAAALTSSCGRYADFTLPLAPGGNTRAIYTFDQRPQPVIERGAIPDVLAPSVVGGDMLYSEWDGKTWRTVHAHSGDGLVWTRRALVLSPDPSTWEGSYIAANGSALRVGGELWYWYHSGPRERPRLGLATSADLVHWTKHPNPVLEPGPYASWDEEGVADPDVIRVDSEFYLYFLGQDRARRQRLGVARSADGVHWQKLRTNPILELGDDGAFDENGLGEPAVWKSQNGFYWMLYTGRDRFEDRRLGLARSTDGIHWQKLPGVFRGTEPWDAKVICDPSVEEQGSEVRVWFGGGDVASPDENLNGQIGFGVLRATLGK